MKNELLKCPFCGSDAMVMPHTHIGEDAIGKWLVICQNPDAECNARLPYCNSKEAAIQQWNRRDKERG